MSPARTGSPPNTKYQHHLSSDGKLGMEPENKAGIIQEKFHEYSHAEGGMQPCCSSTDVKLKSNH